MYTQNACHLVKIKTDKKTEDILADFNVKRNDFFRRTARLWSERKKNKKMGVRKTGLEYRKQDCKIEKTIFFLHPVEKRKIIKLNF